MSEKRAIRRRNWSDDEILILIRSWNDHHNELLCIRRNRHVYDKIASELSLYGYSRDSSEIQLKIKNLSAHYRKEKALLSSSTPYHIEWKYFQSIGQILNSSSPVVGCLERNDVNSTSNSHNFQDDLGDDLLESPGSSHESSDCASAETEALHFSLSPEGNLAIKLEESPGESSSIPENMCNDNTRSFRSAFDDQIPNHTFKRLKKENKTKEDLFEDLIREFKETNKSIKETDLILRNLLKENNDLIKKQNEYILKLLNK